MGIKALEGKEGAGADWVAGDEGQVKLDGQVWMARPLNDVMSTNPANRTTVMHIDGVPRWFSGTSEPSPGISRNRNHLAGQ